MFAGVIADSTTDGTGATASSACSKYFHTNRATPTLKTSQQAIGSAPENCPLKLISIDPRLII